MPGGRIQLAKYFLDHVRRNIIVSLFPPVRKRRRKEEMEEGASSLSTPTKQGKSGKGARGGGENRVKGPRI